MDKLTEFLTKPFLEEDILNEGARDPGIFKAIFLAGGPGSGKSPPTNVTNIDRFCSTGSGTGHNHSHTLSGTLTGNITTSLTGSVTASGTNSFSPFVVVNYIIKH